MNMKILLLFSIFVILLCACTTAPEIQANYDPATLKFDGERAFAIETELVTRFPDRASGFPNNRLAAEWFKQTLSSLGWECYLDEWEIINYSHPTPLTNAVCRLPGASKREILVIAHRDMAATTIQGADNDGSGSAILMHLAEIFAAEGQLPYTLVFVSTDAEEYGMVGTGRYIQTHPNSSSIVAAFSMDNVGRPYYDAVTMELTGQYRKFGPLWLALTLREAARHAGNAWEVYITALPDQITGQMAPVSFMDEGPLIAAGVPALGIAAHVPPEFREEDYNRWHMPEDNLERQSAATLGNVGRVAEAFIRQLQSMQDFPQESGPYLFFDSSNQVLNGLPLWLIFIAFVAIFFLGSILTGRTSLPDKWRAWRSAIPHFLGLWLPMIAFILLLYLFVASGLILYFYRYPAMTKDPYLTNPRWFVFLLALAGLVFFLLLGRRITRRFSAPPPDPLPWVIKSFSLFVIGLAGVYVLVLNPFSLLFFVPLLFWFLIKGRHGAGKILDVVLFFLGGLMLYALIYFFGFVLLRYNFAFFWYLMNMLAIRMVSFPSMVVICAVIAAGMAMIIEPPRLFPTQ